MSQPWHNGFWIISGRESFLMVVDGATYTYKGLISLDYPDAKSFMQGTITAGDYGPAPKDIVDATGVEQCNVQLVNMFATKGGVMNQQGTEIHVPSFEPGKIDVLVWADDAKVQAMKDAREPFDAPLLPAYITPKPGHGGRILWFSGPLGAGKTTSAQLMGRHHGYVFYEADAFGSFVNPFIDVNAENPAFELTRQKAMKGMSTELIQLMQKGAEFFEKLMQGSFEGLDETFGLLIPHYCHHIQQQRERIGGDWAVAWAVFSRKHREALRKLLGPDLVFIVLNMTKECQKERLKSRHMGSEAFADIIAQMFELYEPAGEDEVNAFNVTITETMTPDDVISKVMEVIASLK